MNNKEQKTTFSELTAYKIQWLAVRVRGGRGLTQRDRESIGRYCGGGKWFGPHLVDYPAMSTGFDGLWVMPLTASSRWTSSDVLRELCLERPKLLSRGKEFTFYIFTDAQWGRGYGLTKKQIADSVTFVTGRRPKRA